MSKVKNVAVGDHIKMINGTDLTGCRHFDVARMLKEIPVGSEFTLVNVEPKKAFDAVAPRGALAAPAKELKPGEGRKTLRMKQNGTAVIEEEATGEVASKINKIEDKLESFVGIRDLELSTTMYHLAKDAKSEEQFASALDTQLADFEFPDEFVLDVYEMVTGK